MPAICEVGGGGLFLPLHDSEQLMPLSLRAIAYSCALSLILLASFRLAKILLAALAVVTDRTYSSDRERVPQRENTAIIGVFVIACGIQIPTTLLGVIELVSNNYHVQGLGPSSVVDAGAFGMLAIGAASVLAVPAGQTREVASPAVAMLLVGMSATAYVFLAFILLVTSPGAIEVWEAVVTVALLPAVGLGIARASAAHPVGGAYALHESVRTEEDNGSRPPPQTELDTTSKRAWQGAWWSCCSGGLSCVVPPVRRCGGWPAAATCLMYSGFLAALAGDLSAMLGCVLGLDEALMALYVGIPCGVASQLFCAVHAARYSAHADLALAIIAGLNISAVSVGVGIPWLTGAVYWATAGTTAESAVASRLSGGDYQAALIVPGGAIGFSVAAYCMCALAGVGGFVVQRLAWKGAELGGTRFAACGTASFLFAVWIAYACAVTLNRLHAGVPLGS
jgi:hypothetical protein